MTYRVAVPCIIVVAALLGAGCSGPGESVATLRGDTVQSAATDHVTAVLLVKSWFGIMHVKETIGGPGPAFEIEFLPDGRVHLTGTLSDGTVIDFRQSMFDQSGTGTLTRPDGKTRTQVWDAPVITPTSQTVHLIETMWDGTQLDYTSASDFSDPLHVAENQDGVVTLPDGRSMAYTLARVADQGEQLALTLPDGSSLTVEVPTTPLPETNHWPLFEQGAEGVFTTASGARQEFNVTGQSDRWTRWQFSASDGTSGEFALGEDFEGNGQIQKGGTTLGALQWLPTAFGRLDLLAASTVEVTPSATARDFQFDRWIDKMAAMGPMPLY